MPGMDVRGDQYLNFTLQEAAAWRGGGGVRQQAPDERDTDGAFVPVIGVVASCVVLALIVAAFSGSTPRQMSPDLTRSSVQPRAGAGQGMRRADFQRQAANSLHAPAAYLPSDWFYGRLSGQLPLQDGQGRRIGVLPVGATFFGTTGAQRLQLIVASNGSFWGYGELELPKNVPTSPIAIVPEFEKAARLIGQIESSGIADALRTLIPQRQEPKYGYLPAGWTAGCLAQDAPLTYGMYGIKIGTVRKGTCLLYEIADVQGWRLVISLNGTYRGYAHIPQVYDVPKRTPMLPEYAGAVAVLHRLEYGFVNQEEQ